MHLQVDDLLVAQQGRASDAVGLEAHVGTLAHRRRAQRAGLRATRRAQTVRERRYLRLRHDLLQMEDRLGKLLAFSGRLE